MTTKNESIIKRIFQDLMTEYEMSGDIVITGISGRFPDSDNVDQFWDNLVSGKDMITSEARRWPAGIFGLPERTGLLRDIGSFDASFFGVSAKQAHQMDPQLRILLEIAYEAILDSGYHPSELKGKKVGVYVGGSSSEAYDAWTTDADTQTGYGLLGCCRCMLANRISFTFDFRGPSFTLDTACSSSMFALDAAVKAIECGECDMALAAGVNLLMKPNSSLDFHRLSMLSQDGLCKVFDEGADGYVRAETVAAVMLSKHTLARRAYARVLGSRTNTDGFKTDGITYPNHETQSDLLSDLYCKANVSADQVYYLEMHGTGTQAGDTQEMLGVEKFFLATPRIAALPVGSVKSNMGHSEPGSGVAALVKVLLAYHYNKIPANINFNKANPKLTPIVDGRVFPVTSHLELGASDIIGVNSFGFGGANAHVILQGVSGEESRPVNSEIPMLVPYYNRGAVQTAAALCSIRDEHVTQDKLSYLHMIAQNAPVSHLTRGYVVLNGEKRDPVVSEGPAKKRPLWLVMTGMGAQWHGMGRDMLKYERFRRSVDECTRALVSVQGCDIDLHHLLTSPSAELQTPENAFVALCAVQIGLVDLLSEFGLVPDGIVGHSVGELVCGYADGCLDIRQTITASYFRGKCIRDAGLEEGGMAALGLTWEEAVQVCPPGVVPACHNSQDSVTVSGNKAEVEKLVKRLTKDGLFAKSVQSCGVAFHSPALFTVGPLLESLLKPIIPKPKTRSKNWICTSRKEEDWNEATLCDATYLSNNLVSPVWFHESLSLIPETAIVVEVAACGLLQSILKRALPTCTVVPLMKRKEPKSVEFFLNTIGKLWNEGVNPQFSKFYEAPSLPLVNLPPMSGLVKWDHSVQYTIPTIEDFSRGSGSKNQVSFVYKIDTGDTNSAYHSMVDHVIDGRNLLPATGYLFLAWKSVATASHSTVEKCHVTFQDVKLHQATILSVENPTSLTVILSPGVQKFEVSSEDSLLVSGGYSTEDVSPTFATISEESSGSMVLDKEAIYKEFRLRGYEYGPHYQGIVTSDSAGAAGEVLWTGDWVSFLDTMLQVQLIGQKTRSLHLPTRIRSLSIAPSVHPNPGESVSFAVNNTTKQCTAGGVTIDGLHTTLSQRRVDLRPAVVETYSFYPLHTHTTVLRDDTYSNDVTLSPHVRAVTRAREFIASPSLRYLLDIAQENLPGFGSLSILEIGGLTEFRRSIEEVLNSNPGRPNCKYNLAVESEREKELTDDEHDITSFVWDVNQQTISSKYDVIVTSCAACGEALDKVMNCLSPEGFLVLLSSPQDKVDVGECSASRSCSLGTLSLLRNLKKLENTSHKFVTITPDDFSWVDTLQSAAADDGVGRVWLLGDTSTGVQGLCNALRHEECAPKIRSILSETELSHDEIDVVLRRDLVNNVFIDGEWGTFRHNYVQASPKQLVTTRQHDVTSTQQSVVSAYVDTLTRGDLSSLSWIQSPVVETSQCSITCEVLFASLNFRDVMLATGKLPPDALPLELQGSSDCVLGLEYSGHVIGLNRTKVMGILPAKALATIVTTNPHFTWQVPDNWNLEEAASVPVVYCTVYYSLIVRGRLREGERVLIHSGSGGVGQAAIAIALSLGCQVFTTVGSQQKIDFLLSKFPGLEREHILYSRSTQFEQDLLSLTQSRGVHVVLNSLAGDKLQASLRCLSRHGRFLEIGKFDMSENNPVGMSLFLKNISFHGILLDALFEDGNSDWEEVRSLMKAGIKSGVVQPLPTTLFYNNQLEQAFRYMAQGKHIGKVVISTRDESGRLPDVILPRLSCFSEKCYVITGGLGGFGLELLQWLVQHGARHVTVTSRSGLTSSYQRWVAERLRKTGVTLNIATYDTTTRAGVTQLLSCSVRPVTAIFHLAGILRDGLLESLAISDFEEVFRAKVDTGRHLDAVSRDLCPDLEHFVCFSSVVSGRGNSGQANYAAANSVLERICEQRVRDQLPGVAIQWGAIGDVGMAHNMVGNDANIGGTYPQRIWDCLSTLSQFMTMGYPVMSSLVLADKEKNSACEKGSDLVAVVANILGALDPSKLDHNTSLGDMGLDSLMGVEVKQALEREEIRLSNKEIRNLTLSDISKLQDGPEKEVGREHESSKCDPNKCIVELKKVANTKPLYLIHPITLDLEPLTNIAQHLPCTVCAVQFTPQTPLTSLEALAAYYLSQIRQHRGPGPLRLGGFSFGAVIAFEISLHISETVGSVLEYFVLIDGAPSWVTSQIESYKEQAIKRSGTLDKPTETILSFVRRTFGSEPEGIYEKISVLSPDLDAQIQVAVGVLASTWPTLVNQDTERNMTIFSKLIILAEKYVPRAVFDGDIHLIKAIDSFQVGEDYKLRDVCSGKVHIDSVDGDHDTCVSVYHKDIANHISQHLISTDDLG